MVKNRVIVFFEQGFINKTCRERSNLLKYEILAKTNVAFRENGEKLSTPLFWRQNAK